MSLRAPAATSWVLLAISLSLAQEPATSPDLDLAMKLQDEADQLEEKGRYAEAAELCKKSLAILEKALGPNHPRVAVPLNNLGLLYSETGRLDEARTLLERSIRIKEATYGANSPEVASGLNNLAGIYKDTGNYVQAERLYKQSLAIREKALQPDHPDVAQSLDNLATLYHTLGRNAESEALEKRALAIREKALGPDHPDVSASLNNLGVLYKDLHRLAEAEAVYRRSLAIGVKALGPEHPHVAQTLNNLAALEFARADYAQAEDLFEKCLAIQQKVYGPEHSTVATTLSNLAWVKYVQGKSAEAQALYRRCLPILERTLGPNHPTVASSLVNLAQIYRAQGKAALAEPLLQRALAIDEAALGPDNPHVAICLFNLATLRAEQGGYAQAKALLERATAIQTKALGAEHPSLSRILNSLAVICGKQGDFAQAEAFYRQSLALRERALGPTHPEVASSLGNLGELLFRQGRYDDAEPLYRRAIDILERAFGPAHPRLANPLTNLAVLYSRRRQFDKAQPLLRCALAITEATSGKDSPELLDILNNLASLELDRGNGETAWAYVVRANRILLASRAHMAPSALGRASVLAQGGIRGFLPGLALTLHKDVDVFALLEQEQALGLRELLARAQVQAAIALPEHERQRLDEVMARINALNTALERQASAGHAVDALRQDLQRAELDYDALNADLNQRYDRYATAQGARSITSAQLAASPALDGRSAAVGWIEFRDRVWAYVVRPSGVTWVDQTRAMPRSDEAPLIDRILALGREPASRKPLAAALARFYRERMASLEPHLRGVERLVVIAQGWPAFLPAEMLLTAERIAGNPPADGDLARWPWLADRYEISYAPSVTALDLLCRHSAERKGRTWPRPLVALGDPPFSPAQLAQMKSETETPLAAAAELPLVALSRLVQLDPTAVPPRLPGTRREVRLVADLLGGDRALLLLGPDASERKLFAASARGDLAQCRYVHLATHGLADGDRPELSALVLARAPDDPDYDGLLQMREVFHLKLDADLVTLSACQTGLGKELRGEGVVGLSTAFFFAGTPSVVMSLWNVSDVSTGLLMRRFYANLKAGQTKAAALREAKAWLRNLTRSDLERLSRTDPLLSGLTRGLGPPTASPKGRLIEDKPFAHPHYWAGFVLTGDPR